MHFGKNGEIPQGMAVYVVLHRSLPCPRTALYLPHGQAAKYGHPTDRRPPDMGSSEPGTAANCIPNRRHPMRAETRQRPGTINAKMQGSQRSRMMNDYARSELDERLHAVDPDRPLQIEQTS